MIKQNPQSSVTREMAIGDTVDREAWSQLTIFKQMGSILPELQQALKAFHNHDDLSLAQAIEKALDMFDATVEVTNNQERHRIKEILMAKNEFLRLFYLEHSPEEEASLERYFRWFALGPRLN